jgi:hypothetical protein
MGHGESLNIKNKGGVLPHLNTRTLPSDDVTQRSLYEENLVLFVFYLFFAK